MPMPGYARFKIQRYCSALDYLGIWGALIGEAIRENDYSGLLFIDKRTRVHLRGRSVRFANLPGRWPITLRTTKG